MTPDAAPTIARDGAPGDMAPPAATAQPRRGLRARLADGVVVIVTGGVFIGLAALGIAALYGRAAAEPPRVVSPPISVATVTLRLEPGYDTGVRYTGRLEAARQTSVAFERGGLVMAIAHDEGAMVRAGETIARLDTAQLQSGRRQLEARRRELEAQRTLASLTLGRQSRLKAQGFSPEQRLDEAQASLAQLTAAMEQVAAQIAGVDIDLAKSELKAPFDGTVAARAIDEGAVVAAGTPVLTLVETARRQARIGLPPDVAQSLAANRVYRLDAGRQVLEARLVARRPDLETGTRTVTALFDVAGPAVAAAADKGGLTGPAAVMLGDLVTLSIETPVPERGAWLPLTALKEGRRGLWTILVADSGPAPPDRAGSATTVATGDARTVRAEAVEVLHTDGARAYVRGTFRDGDRVLSGGTDRVVAGQRVALAPE